MHGLNTTSVPETGRFLYMWGWFCIKLLRQGSTSRAGKLNEKSASEIGRVNEPLASFRDFQKEKIQD